jgi:transcription elongation GreA/GreB family factor
MRCLPTKQALKAELVALVEDDLRTLERVQRATAEGATHPEAKIENSKHTRALEQSYLARGQAARAEELRLGLALVRTLPTEALPDGTQACSGALVGLAEGDEEYFVLLSPFGGGYKLAGGTIPVVTPQSPLGKGIIDKVVGEECELTVAGRRRQVEIFDVR